MRRVSSPRAVMSGMGLPLFYPSPTRSKKKNFPLFFFQCFWIRILLGLEIRSIRNRKSDPALGSLFGPLRKKKMLRWSLERFTCRTDVSFRGLRRNMKLSYPKIFHIRIWSLIRLRIQECESETLFFLSTRYDYRKNLICCE